ncbi:hypothetical protein DDD_0211 [Nonlabens dokdonensis DSW-6]|uniref:Uncharacterized protein n=1 Tax=Nonlabens dokdonensis (strain DSM 17205 / KCTC 12402 / DSW-6) TaxID=592029 RepID=L7W924_NONDD|nr:hypothetical protein DDD_0211 [Nonlabens dokdonensis DSW-6]
MSHKYFSMTDLVNRLFINAIILMRKEIHPVCHSRTSG